MTDLLTFLRKAKPLPPVYSAMLSPILNAIIQKMRYDETSDWGSEDEQTDEAEFQELRKRLQVLQKSVSAVDEDLYVDILSNLVGNTFQKLGQQGGQMDWRDLDLALHEMYLFGELTVPNGGLYTKSQPSGVAAERLIIMMAKMVESGKLNHMLHDRYQDLLIFLSQGLHHLLTLPFSFNIWRFVFDTVASSRRRQVISHKFLSSLSSLCTISISESARVLGIYFSSSSST